MMNAKYIVIEVWPSGSTVDRDELYNEISRLAGWGMSMYINYSTSQENLYYLLQRCAEDMGQVRVMQIGSADTEEE